MFKSRDISNDQDGDGCNDEMKTEKEEVKLNEADDKKDKEITQDKAVLEASEENKWDKVDWNKINSEKAEENKWDKVDWNKTNSEKAKLDDKNIKDNISVEIKDKAMEPAINNENINLNQKNELSEKDYENFSNNKLNVLFKQYRNETGKFPNQRFEITSEFINWIELNKKFPKSENDFIEKEELVKACHDINKNQEIKQFLSFQEQNTKSTMYKISDDLYEMGINISRNDINQIRHDAKVSKNWNHLNYDEQ